MDKKRFDVGIFGYTMGDNYGGITTYYALYKYIKSLGKNVCIIPPLHDRNWCKLSVDFFRSHCNCLKKLKSVDYDKYNQVVDTFVLGSDQLWSDIFYRWGSHVYLEFVKPGHKKIGYGISYGNNYPPCVDVDPMLIPKYTQLINSFDYISHREKNACNITRRWFDRKDTVHVLDPVFLVPVKIWYDLISEIEYNIPSNIITYYMIESRSSFLKTFHNISSKLGLNEILICTNNTKKLQAVIERSTLLDFETPINFPDSPVDFRIWLRYMRDSEKILVSSYHGICFSLIFKKNFVCFRSKNIYDTRILDILKTVGLEDRMIDEYDIDKAIELYNTPIDWNNVCTKLNKMISKSKNWLKNALI